MSLQLNSQLIKFYEKIYFELVNLINFKQTKSFLFKLQNIKVATANRSNIHYR